MRRRLTREPVEEPTVNLTPLIDVVFVILIMFIVVAPLLDLDKVQLADAPTHSHDIKNITETSSITIHVRKDNSILYNSEKVSVQQLAHLLREAKKRFPKTNPQLFHDKEAHFGVYQSVKNAAESAGFKELDIVLKPS